MVEFVGQPTTALDHGDWPENWNLGHVEGNRKRRFFAVERRPLGVTVIGGTEAVGLSDGEAKLIRRELRATTFTADRVVQTLADNH